MKCKISVDEHWPIFAIDKIDTTGKNEQYEIEIPESFYTEYVWATAQYALLQDQLKRYYDECTRKISRSCPYRFQQGTDLNDQYEHNAIRSSNVAEATV